MPWKSSKFCRNINLNVYLLQIEWHDWRLCQTTWHTKRVKWVRSSQLPPLKMAVLIENNMFEDSPFGLEETLHFQSWHNDSYICGECCKSLWMIWSYVWQLGIKKQTDSSIDLTLYIFCMPSCHSHPGIMIFAMLQEHTRSEVTTGFERDTFSICPDVSHLPASIVHPLHFLYVKLP